MKTRDISLAGLIAAIYVVIALVLAPISFGVYQVRVSEALTILPFLTPAAIPGLFIGCLLANIFGGMGWQDIVFGSLITLIAAFMTRGAFHISRGKGSNLIAVLAILLFWVGAFYTLMQDTISIAPLVLVAFSILYLWLSERSNAKGSSNRYRVGLRGASLGLLIYAGYLLYDQPELNMMVIGLIALLAAWLGTWIALRFGFQGRNLNLILAPLPPVLLNAFGVAWYLAPIIGTEYWFTVQMIGVGQLIACYGLGLPLLLLLEKRKVYFFN